MQPLEVEIGAVRLEGGLADRARASLGGQLYYEVTVTVRNKATYVVNDITAAARFTREQYSDDRAIDIDDPGSLEGGDTWTQVVDVAVPALTTGEVRWLAEAAGTGTPVIATDTTSHQPIALYAVAAVLLVDLIILLWRFFSRRRRKRAARRRPPPDNPFTDGGPPGADIEAELVREFRVPEPVG